MPNRNEFESPKIKPLEIKIVRNENIDELGEKTDYLIKPFSLFINGEEIKDVIRFSIDLDRSKLCNADALSDWKYTIEKVIPVFK